MATSTHHRSPHTLCAVRQETCRQYRQHHVELVSVSCLIQSSSGTHVAQAHSQGSAPDPLKLLLLSSSLCRAHLTVRGPPGRWCSQHHIYQHAARAAWFVWRRAFAAVLTLIAAVRMQLHASMLCMKTERAQTGTSILALVYECAI
jgi:hypothetical protein